MVTAHEAHNKNIDALALCRECLLTPLLKNQKRNWLEGLIIGGKRSERQEKGGYQCHGHDYLLSASHI